MNKCLWSVYSMKKLYVRLSENERIKNSHALKLRVFVHSSNKYMLSTCWVPGTDLSSGSAQEIKQTKPLPSRSLNSVAGRRTKIKCIKWGFLFLKTYVLNWLGTLNVGEINFMDKELCKGKIKFRENGFNELHRGFRKASLKRDIWADEQRPKDMVKQALCVHLEEENPRW